jgi:GNAT superfamily N-acetyltransferase
VMVRPELQGIGAGRLLVDGLHGMARDLGLEQLQLTFGAVRGSNAFMSALVTSSLDVIRAPCDSPEETNATR